MRKTYLDHLAYEADAIEKTKSGDDDPTQQAFDDALHNEDVETVIVPM